MMVKLMGSYREEFPLSSVYPVLGDRDFYPPGQPNPGRNKK
jgi:hypothetical protein